MQIMNFQKMDKNSLDEWKDVLYIIYLLNKKNKIQ